MNKVTYSIFSILFLLTISSCQKEVLVGDTTSCDGADMPQYNTTHPRAAEIQSLMDQLVASGIPAVSILIRDADGLWIGKSGTADITHAVAVQPCNIMRIASITKPMVVTTAMQLYQNGLLDIDRPIGDFLDDDIVRNVSNVTTATVRQCMNHSSGIYDHIDNLNFQTAVLNNPTHKWQPRELAEFAYGQPAYFAPGSSTHYSNLNTVLIALCIEKVTGENHGQLLHQRIFSPLAMGSTFYYSFDDILPATTHGYFDLYGNGKVVDVSNFNTGIAHTAVYSTVYDLEKFLRALLIEKTMVDTSTLAQMMTFLPDNSDSHYGYGLGLFRKLLGHSTDISRAGIGHTGGEFGYSGKWFYYPAADVTIISLCNYGTNIKTATGDLYHQFHNDVEKVLMP